MSDDEIVEREMIIVELLQALKPFVLYGERLDANYTTRGYPDACTICLTPDHPNKGAPTVGDLRHAARLVRAIEACKEFACG